VFDENLFDMGNEPDIHYPWLFNYVKGEEWRSQKEAQKLMERYFKNAPDGLPGNDDCGTLSAWIVFGMMGLYPVCPGDTRFAISCPVFDEVNIKLDAGFYPGKELVIERTGENKAGSYIKEIRKNGKRINSFFIDHKDLVLGGVLEIIK